MDAGEDVRQDQTLGSQSPGQLLGQRRHRQRNDATNYCGQVTLKLLNMLRTGHGQRRRDGDTGRLRIQKGHKRLRQRRRKLRQHLHRGQSVR